MKGCVVMQNGVPIIVAFLAIVIGIYLSSKGNK